MRTLLLLVLIGLIAGCGGGGENGGGVTVSGMVVDLDYEPISGATVADASHTATTLSDGTYSLTSSTGTRLFTISAPGYTTSYRMVNVKGGGNTVPLVILAPLDSKVTQIGPSGGLVSNTSGSLKLNIPSGALSDPYGIRLTEVPLIAAPTPPPTGHEFIAVIVYISPYMLDLGSYSALLSIPNVTHLATGTDIPFYHLNTDTLEWQEIMDAGGLASIATDSITAEVHLFGWTAAIVKVAPAVGIVRGVVRDNITMAGIPDASVWISYYGTVADGYGAYELSNIPMGPATVEAIAAGYNAGTRSITVVSGETIEDQDILLTRRSIGTVTGKIKVAGTSTGISGARVFIDQMETSSDVDGIYTLTGVPADRTVVATACANGYVNNQASGYLEIGGTLQRDISLTPTSAATAWTDDFETNKGWTVNSLGGHYSCTWQRIQSPETRHDSLSPTYVTLPDSGYLPSARSGSYSYWFGVTPESETAGCYIGVQSLTDTPESGGETISSSVLVRAALESPIINLTAFAYAKLSFWTWWETECMNIATGYDKMYIQIATNAVFDNWTTIGVLNPVADPDFSVRSGDLPYSSGGFDQPGEWVMHDFDLTPYVGNNVKVRFVFDSKDTHYNGFRGWLIDDFSLSPEQISGSSISSSAVEKRPDHGIIKSLPRQ